MAIRGCKNQVPDDAQINGDYHPVEGVVRASHSPPRSNFTTLISISHCLSMAHPLPTSLPTSLPMPLSLLSPMTHPLPTSLPLPLSPSLSHVSTAQDSDRRPNSVRASPERHVSLLCPALYGTYFNGPLARHPRVHAFIVPAPYSSYQAWCIGPELGSSTCIYAMVEDAVGFRLSVEQLTILNCTISNHTYKCTALVNYPSRP